MKVIADFAQQKLEELMMPYRRAMLAALAVFAAAALTMGVGRTAQKSELPGRKPGASRPAGSAKACYASVLIKDVPHIRQKPDFCGEACAAMYLRKLGRAVDQDYVFERSGLDPLLGRGCYTKELVAALKEIGFRTGPAWYKVPVATRDKHLDAQWKALHTDLAAGVPSIVCMHYDRRAKTTEHFRLVLGYDTKTDEVIYHEPARDEGAYRRMSRAVLLKLWPLEYDARQSTLVRIRLEPARLKPARLKSGEVSKTFTAADYAQHMMKLKKKIPGQGFTVLIEHPFVVIGDEPPTVVKRRSKQTVRWAVDRLKELYFEKDPKEILDIWLFKDKASYRKHVKEVFGSEPSTPFGYFSAADGALVMNIATGGGTLVHEIVHPFVAANFPRCPAWFNEGIGTLYEQCREQDGHIHGLTNWRLAGLQEAIRRKRVPQFKTLCSTTTREFYERDPGTNYAQARYLCYYLQQHDLLVKYYHRFRAKSKDDPTGYDTLKEILGRNDMQAFKQDWEAYVLKLRFS